MLTLEQVKAALKDRKPGAVAEDTGVARQIIWRVAHTDAGISYANLKKLSDYLERPL